MFHYACEQKCISATLETKKEINITVKYKKQYLLRNNYK